MLALPKGRFFCFLHYRCWPLYVQHFIFNFLCICFSVSGTSFFSCSSFKDFPPVAFTCAVQTSTGASRRADRAVLRLRWCRFPTLSPKPHTGPHKSEFVFSPKNEFTPPPKGGGVGFCSSLVVRVLLGSCLWQLLATTGSQWPNRAGLGLCWCRFPTRPPKPHTGPHRGEFGFHRLFLVRFGVGRADKSFSSL